MYFTTKNVDPCLILAMEEAGEFVRACSKVIRHGLDEKRKAHLIEEAGDVLATMYLLEAHGLFEHDGVIKRAKEKLIVLQKREEENS